MKIDFEGRTWQLELTDVDMTQGDTIAAYTGLSLMGWYRSLLDTDSLAWAKSARCLYWLMWQQNPQNGASLPLETLNFKPLVLFTAFAEAIDAEQPAEAAEEDPTKPADDSAVEEPTPAGVQYQRG